MKGKVLPTDEWAYSCTKRHGVTLRHPITVKVKVKVTLEQTTTAQRWSRGIAILFL
jgi:hypothetical protein